MMIRTPTDLADAVTAGLVRLGRGTVIEMDVELCHSTRDGQHKQVVLEQDCHIRSGTIVYSGVHFGAGAQTGHHVVIREDTSVGEGSVLGTGVKVEMGSRLGDHVLIETQAHVTGFMTIEDYVFVGPGCITTNDERMLHRRAGAASALNGPLLRWGCRIGGGSVLLPGVTVGREAVVAAGSLVSRDIPDRTIAGGNPLRLLGPVGDHEPVLLPS